MINEIVLCGLQNSGKSSIINTLSHSNTSLVSSQPNTTVDYVTCKTVIANKQVTLYDTPSNINVAAQKLFLKANLILFITSAEKENYDNYDRDSIFVKKHALRTLNCHLIINKWDQIPSLFHETTLNRYKKYGLKSITPFSTKNKKYIQSLFDLIDIHTTNCPVNVTQAQNFSAHTFSFIGKPNVGKSSLFNQLLRQYRSTISPIPHTTIDSIAENLENDVILMDSAGLTKNSKIPQNNHHHAIVVVTAEEPHISKFELKLINKLNYTSLTIVINKVDLNPNPEITILKRYFPYIPLFKVSAKSKQGLRQLRQHIKKKYTENKAVSTNTLNKELKEIITTNPPPIKKHKLPKLKYIQASNNNIFIHGTHLTHLTQSYKNYVKNKLEKVTKIPKHQLKIKYLNN